MRWLPAQSLIDAIVRFDQLPVLPVGGVRVAAAARLALEVSPAVRRAEASVLLVEGTSCGLTLQGSGWVVRPGLVATNAHVLSGEHDTRVLFGDRRLTAQPGLRQRLPRRRAAARAPASTRPRWPLATRPRSGTGVAMVGYPGRRAR